METGPEFFVQTDLLQIWGKCGQSFCKLRVEVLILSVRSQIKQLQECSRYGTDGPVVRGGCFFFLNRGYKPVPFCKEGLVLFRIRNTKPVLYLYLRGDRIRALVYLQNIVQLILFEIAGQRKQSAKPRTVSVDAAKTVCF